MIQIDLKGKNAFVCGGSKGIGFAAAQMMAQAGASVCIVSRSEESLKNALNRLDTSNGQRHRYLAVDFSDYRQVKNIVSKHLQQIDYSYDILVNNTGGPPAGPIAAAKEDEFLAAFNNHLLCNHVLVQLLSPAMIDKAYGRIINVISTSVKVPLKGLGVSNTIRAAVANWAKTLATEWAAMGITVNNVLPGATATERLHSIIENKSEKSNQSAEVIEKSMLAEIPMQRFGKPEEIAAVILFLASPLSSYVTGINVPVDGGRTPCL